MYAVTGATGQLGRLVIDALLRSVKPGQIAALVRDRAKAADVEGRGVQVRAADYDRPETLEGALQGVSRLLLISSDAVGRRTLQHRAVIDAAVRAGVELIAYTSVLHADRSPLGLAQEHRETEAALAEAGLPAMLLRNGWYTENYLMGVPQTLAHDAVTGAAGEGRISSASRQDYADAAAAALVADAPANRTYELAGDDAYTLAELAAEIGRLVGRPIAYNNFAPADYAAMLKSNGVPADFAAMLADFDACAAKGALFDDGHDLSRLIGRPTTPLSDMVAKAVASA